MTEADSSMGSLPKEAKKGSTPQESQRAAVRELVEVAHARGVDLTGPDGLLEVSTKEVVEFRPNLRRQLSSDADANDPSWGRHALVRRRRWIVSMGGSDASSSRVASSPDLETRGPAEREHDHHAAIERAFVGRRSQSVRDMDIPHDPA